MSQYFNSDTAGLQSEDEGSQRKRKKKRHVSDSEPEERSDDDYITQKIPLNLPAIPRPFPVSQTPDPSARLYDLDEGRSYTNLNFPTSSRPQFSAMNPNPSDISPLTLPDGRDVQQFNSPKQTVYKWRPNVHTETLVHDPSVLTAARPLDQINRTFINRSGPTSASSDQNCVFQPVFRVGQGGPIPCSAAQQHILLMLENIKQQQSQLAATVNILLTRMGSTPPVSAELPEEFQFPLDDMEEVATFESWIQNPDNSRKKQNLISALAAVDWTRHKEGHLEHSSSSLLMPCCQKN
ncbi:hypothetical protein UPYG_G00031320 [Umbra pygmaea]|uniref:Uncharacterized protein n=1 Tax=Umbra pygmaea TaxID=75934 RepID=A0ABD0XMT9_UMBPY